MSLSRPLQEIRDDVIRFVERSNTTEVPPYFVYVYDPKDEYPVRRDMADLKLAFEANDIRCASISLADLFWEAIDASGDYDAIVGEELARPDDPKALDDIHQTINEILRDEPSLSQRVRQRMESFPARSVAFLYRAGALYPAYRTSSLLEDLRERLLVPVVLMYPGHVVGGVGLSFMGKCEPAHGYRAKIVQRSGV
ncbi:MAG: DUF1788 domain-containing protein [Acidimicrobiia bacterium]|nr:DUF1788 domain-containing protein [Acidimicrobiia bacterium]